MKSSEFTRVDEGVSDWLAQRGLFGKTRQMAAVGAQMQREKQALGQALGQENNKNFLQQLPVDIESAIRGNQITAPGGGGRSMEEFVSEYVKTLFKNFAFDPQTESAIDRTVTDFANTYMHARNPKNPVLYGESLKKAQAIWDAAKAGSAITTNAQASGAGRAYFKPPPAGEEVITARGKYEFDGTKWHMTEKVTSPPGSRFPAMSPLPAPKEITDRAQILELNRLAAST